MNNVTPHIALVDRDDEEQKLRGHIFQFETDDGETRYAFAMSNEGEQAAIMFRFEPEADLNLVVSLLMFLQSSEVSHISSQVTDVLDFMNGNVGGPDVA